MIKIVTVIGARPQIIKAAALSRAITKRFSDQIVEVIVHTGQHYDTNMSQVFFDELGIPAPEYNLRVGSASHGFQTARMIEGLEKVLQDEQPACLVLYGDTNSTLAGAVTAAKMHIPIIHVEAGLRSFNKRMPEEINRILCDHTSTLLFSPTITGFRNLIREGFTADNQKPFSPDHPGIFFCGDVMYDNSLFFAQKAEEESNVLLDNGLKSGGFILATIHRNNNTDDPERLQSIFSGLLEIAHGHNELIVLPLHPRTNELLEQNLDKELYQQVIASESIKILRPVSFLDMIKLESNCKMVITDSGGVQKEAYFFKKPGIILRSETEWVEIVAEMAALIVDADKNKMLEAYKHFSKSDSGLTFPPLFGDGNAANFICETILSGF